MKVLRDEWIRASDGTRLCADIYLPDAPGSYPTLYAVAPYQKDLVHLPPVSAFRFRETGPIDFWVERGYALVVGDQRGTGKSEGRFELFGKAEQQDLYDTIEWIATQPWSTGKVAMIGESGYSITQWQAAAMRPPHLACALIYNALIDPYRDAVYHGGVFSMGFFNFWTTDNVRASASIGGGASRPGGVATDLLGLVLEHPLEDAFWHERSVDGRVANIDVPTMVVAFWYNVGLHLRGSLLGFEQLRGRKRLLVLGGADSHTRFFDRAFLLEHIAPWYDHWLKDADRDVLAGAPVRIEVQNGGGLRDEPAWPIARAEATRLYLDPAPAHAVTSLNDGSLSAEPPPAGTPPTAFAYPNPEWTVGTTIIGEHGIPHPVRGILTFTSERLPHDTEVTGPICVVLYVASDQTDTEFFIKISEQQDRARLKAAVMGLLAGDLPPPATMVTRGWLKASHRALDPNRSTLERPFHTHARAEPVEPGAIIRYDIEVWPTSYLFRKGHRIRIEIANGDSPVADGLFHHYYGHKAGRDLFHHDADHPSHVLLPIVPR